jgi:Methylamine utilization protein MauJ
LITPRFNPPENPLNQGPPEGLEGTYEATLVLSRPGYSLVPEGHATSADKLEGDSHLAISAPAAARRTSRIRIEADIDGEQFEFEGRPNRKGFLGKIVGTFHAYNLHDAYAKAYRALAPFLSYWSTRLDLPLNIFQTDTKETRRGALRLEFRAPFPDTLMPTNVGGPIERDLRGLTSIYQEALTANSDTYRFLCFWKIIKSLLDRRSRLDTQAKRGGGTCRAPVEILPSNEAGPDLRPIQPPNSGQVIAIPQVGGLHHRYQRLAA